MPTISVEINGLDTAVTIMHRVALAATHRHDLLIALTSLIRAQTRRRFQDKVDPDGRPWKPLAASTVAGGREQGTMLIRTGRLAGSISAQVSGDVGIVKTTVEYAKFHHTGSFKIPNHPPKRQFLGIGARDVKEIEEATAAFLQAVIG